MIKRYMRSELYHGRKKNHGFFEGGYFKLVSADRKHSLALIPGISKVADGGDSHSFVQVLRESDSTHYVPYEVDKFSFNDNPFEVRVGRSLFSLERLSVNVLDGNVDLSGEVTFRGLFRWPSSLRAPGAMGWFSYVPFMQCYHGILSMDHELEGFLVANGKELDFNGGRGYIEKDWGRSFPSAWIWMQSNHFSVPRVSLTLSIATVPWLGRAFTGMIGGFLYEGTLYRFTTYNGAKIVELRITEEKVNIRLRRKNHELIIEAERNDGGTLKSPVMGNMKGRIKESLASRIRIRFVRDNKVIFDDVGTNAGLEIVESSKWIVANGVWQEQ